MPKKKNGAKPGRESVRAQPKPSLNKTRKPRPNQRQTIDDWKTLNRKTRQHINTRTGEILSDRQYRKLFLYKGATLERVAKSRGAPTTRYSNLLKERQTYLEKHGVKASLRDVRSSADMQRITRELANYKKHYKKLKGSSAADRLKWFGPDSDLAHALADLGLRDPDSRLWVGDS